MKYLIFCKRTNKHIATYTNEKTLETLDTSRCYYLEDKPQVKQLNEYGVDKVSGKKESEPRNVKTNLYFKEQSKSSDTGNDYMSPVNPIGYYATMSTLDNSSSSSCDSSSSYDSSSSSSCDSSSW